MSGGNMLQCLPTSRTQNLFLAGVKGRYAKLPFQLFCLFARRGVSPRSFPGVSREGSVVRCPWCGELV